MEYWQTKVAKNKKRDADDILSLKAAGWEWFVVWECQLKELSRVQERLTHFLGEGNCLVV